MRFAVEVVRARPRGRRARTSSSSTGSRCSTWSRTGRRGTRWSPSPARSRRPGRPSSTPASAGTRPGCRRSSPRCPRAAFTGYAARLGRARRHPGVRVEPDQHPRGGRAASLTDGADLVSLARPFLADPDFVAKAADGPRRRDQHLHRLQPGLPGPHLRQAARLLPGQPARLPTRPSSCSAVLPRAARSRSSAPDRPGWRPRSPLAERGHDVDAVRGRRPSSAASSDSRCASPARRSSPRRCATSRGASRCSGCGCGCRRGPTPTRWWPRGSTTSSSRPGWSLGSPRSPASTTRWS